jgi:hypothetical protein
MKLTSLRIGTKLYLGFIAVLILTVLVGIIAYSGISNIVYQIEISRIVNRIIVDSEDAQVSSLKYIIYEEEKYFNETKEEAANVDKLGEDAKKLLLSDANKEVTDKIKEVNNNYLQANINYYELEQKKKQLEAIRCSAVCILFMHYFICLFPRNKANK